MNAINCTWFSFTFQKSCSSTVTVTLLWASSNQTSKRIIAVTIDKKNTWEKNEQTDGHPHKRRQSFIGLEENSNKSKLKPTTTTTTTTASYTLNECAEEGASRQPTTKEDSYDKNNNNNSNNKTSSSNSRVTMTRKNNLNHTETKKTETKTSKLPAQWKPLNVVYSFDGQNNRKRGGIL